MHPFRRSYHTNGKFFISRVIDQLVSYRSDILSERTARLTIVPCFFQFTQFIELASAIGDRVPGPCFVTVNPQNQNDMLSLVEAARRLHQTFAEQGVPREVIVSVCPNLLFDFFSSDRAQDISVRFQLLRKASWLHRLWKGKAF